MGSSSVLSSISSSTLGTGQGIDVASSVAQLVAALRTPERQWQGQQQNLQFQISSLTQLNNELSALSNAVDSLNDPAGAITARTVTSSQSTLVSATAANGAASGSHVVIVNSLATTGSYYSDAAANSSTALALGSFTIQVGSGAPTTITIDNTNNTLDGLAASINGQNLGITASVINDATGARLALVSSSSGASGDLTISSVANGLAFNKGVSGTNASLTVDGVPISSSSNTVSGVVPGLTLNLLGAAPGSEVQVSVAPDTAKATQAVSDFVSAYNSIIQDLNSQFTFNATTQSAGPLAGDSAAREVQNQLLTSITFTNGTGAFNSLASLGVSMNNDGTLTVDNAKLGNAISSNYAAVQGFFQDPSSGFAANLHAQLSTLTSPTQGAFSLDIKGKTDTQQSLQDQIDQFEVYIASKQQQLTLQYQQIDVMLRELPVLQQQLDAELGFTNNKSNQ